MRIELPERPVLAGYPGHRRAREWSQPVYVRALALEVSGRRAVIAAIDTLLIPPGFGQREGCELLAATHTHTGPGGLWDTAVAGWLGAGAPDAKQREAAERAHRKAVAEAVADLGPVELQAARESWPAGPARPRSEGVIDPELVALRARRPGGATVATVIVYGMHPTSAPRDVLSADWPGEVGAEGVALVLQGAGGNATWERGSALAEPLAAEVARMLDRASPLGEARLGCSVGVPAIPPPRASLRVPWVLRRAASNAIALLFPPAASQTRLSIGPLELLGIPGEPVGELGLASKPAVVVGLAGGYLGYVETEEHWRAAAGESARTYFGPGLARALGLAR